MLKAPVDSRWSCSKRSCSSLGRRGGDGPGQKESKAPRDGVVREKERETEKREARGAEEILNVVRRGACMVGMVRCGI